MNRSTHRVRFGSVELAIKTGQPVCVVWCQFDDQTNEQPQSQGGRKQRALSYSRAFIAFRLVDMLHRRRSHPANVSLDSVFDAFEAHLEWNIER